MGQADWRLLRQAAHPFGPVGAQAVGHLVNLGSQAALAAQFGLDLYGALGLGLVAAATLCFLGEGGYPAIFMREAARGADWLGPWRAACLHRLVLSAMASLAVLAWWLTRYGAGHGGFQLLLAAVPGILAAALNPAPLLYGLDRPVAAAGATHARWLVHGLGIAAALAWAAPDQAGWWVGGAFSAGLTVQTGWAASRGLPWRVLLPAPGRPPAGAALGLWAVGLLGTLNDRALPFLVEHVRPDLVAPILLLLQVLQGATALIVQLDRLVLPRLARESGDRVALAGRLTLYATVPAGLLAIGAMALAPRGDLQPAALILAEWIISVEAATLVSALVASQVERRLFILFLAIVPLGLALQAAAVPSAALALVLAIRVLAALLLNGGMRRLAGLAPVPGWPVLAGLAVLGLLAFA